MAHEGYRFDDIQLGQSFWSSLNGGYEDMNYKWAFETFRGRGSYPPERIFLKEGDFNALVEQLNLPSDATIEAVKRLMKRKTLFENSPELNPKLIELGEKWMLEHDETLRKLAK